MLGVLRRYCFFESYCQFFPLFHHGFQLRAEIVD